MPIQYTDPLTTPNGSSVGSLQPFLHGCCRILPIRYTFLRGGVGVTWYLGSTPSTTLNGILIELAVFPQYTMLPTDRTTTELDVLIRRATH